MPFYVLLLFLPFLPLLPLSKLLQFENNKKSLHLILTKPEAVDIWDSDLSAQLTVFFFVKRNLPENVHINYAAGKQRIEQQHHVEQQLVEQQHVDLVEQQQDVVEVLLRVFLESNLTEKISVLPITKPVVLNHE